MNKPMGALGQQITLSLSDKLLLAAVELSSGSIEVDFTAEDLVVAAWQADKLAFGLRGHEQDHPDSNKVYTKLDGRTGLVTKGWLSKFGERRLRITQAGLARAVELRGGADTDLLAKLDRTLQAAVGRILSHPEFISWLKDRAKPSRFRGAGYFWGIAPGTPPTAVRSRVNDIEQTLKVVLEVLDKRGVTDVVKQRGQVLFEKRDVELALEFHNSLKTRFASDLKILDPEGSYEAPAQPSAITEPTS
jgi:hypothetical protein